MIHYFNPGHETAVLNASKHYQPAANQVRMQQELAFLPAWYANPEDFVWVENKLSAEFMDDIKVLNPVAQAITISDLPGRQKELSNQKIDLWGISPQSVYQFEKLNRFHAVHWQVPEWKEEYRLLGSRPESRKILSCLMDICPEIEKEILPRYFSTIEEIENYIIQNKEKQLVKSPYSSSGRGLVWLPPGKLNQSEKQIISGMLKKQSQVSIEKALDKQLDFSMHFQNDDDGKTYFTGYSVFQTNEKGAYEKSLLASQETLEKQPASYLDKEYLHRIKEEFISILQKTYSPHYKGNIGVDMMAYKSGNQYKLHPCVEINLRKSMGYLAIRFQENYLHPLSQGEFFINYYSNAGEVFKQHRQLKKQYPLIIENRLIKSGYLSLCPVGETSQYHACILCKARYE
jgi:hypothetical protein